MGARKVRGFSLIELTVSASVGLILVASATAVMLSMADNKKKQQRIVEVQADSSTSVSRAVYDLQRAGYRLPSPMFAVRFFDNYTPDANAPASVAPGPAVNWASMTNAEANEFGDITTARAALCPSGSLGVYGTDIVEVSEGSPTLSPGAVTNVQATGYCTNPGQCGSAVGCTCDTAQVKFSLGGSKTPMDSSETTTQSYGTSSRPILVFMGAGGSGTGIDTTSCALELISTDGTTFTGQYLGSNYLRPSSTAHTTVPCPAVGMLVYRLQKRTRYALCGPPTQFPKASRFIDRTEINGGNPPRFSTASTISGGAHFDSTTTTDSMHQTVQTGVSNLQFEMIFKPFFGTRITGINGGTGSVLSCYNNTLGSFLSNPNFKCGSYVGLGPDLCRATIGSTNSGLMGQGVFPTFRTTLSTPCGTFANQVPHRGPASPYSNAYANSTQGFDFWAENTAVINPGSSEIVSPARVDNRHWSKGIWFGVTSVSKSQDSKADYEPNLSNRFFYCDANHNERYDGPSELPGTATNPADCQDTFGRSTRFSGTYDKDGYQYRQVTRSIKFDNLADEVMP